MRTPEWNSLCWLVERERRKGKEENCPLRESKIFPRSSRHPSYIKEVSVAGPSDLACPKVCSYCSPRASLLHTCMKVPKWDADPEC
jgi:hypothetical protein